MEIDPGVFSLVNILLKVILVSLIISTPAIILTIEMYAYERYKKWKNTEAQEKEKIILGRAKQIAVADEELQRQHDDKLRLGLDIELLEKKKKALQDELGESEKKEVEDPEEETDLAKLSIKELHALCKKREIKRYSKLKKSQVIELLRK